MQGRGSSRRLSMDEKNRLQQLGLSKAMAEGDVKVLVKDKDGKLPGNESD